MNRRMIGPGSLAWFAGHEMRLAWRDWTWLLSGGRRRHWSIGALGLGIVVLLGHGLAYVAIAHSHTIALVFPPDKHSLVVIGGTLGFYGSLMLSQALENVTRAFFARGDLDLVLSSPAAATRLFTVRLGAMAVSVMGMALILGAPVIDVLIILGGAHWLAAYGAMAALAVFGVAVSGIVTVLLFAVIGPKRTRLVAQVISAIVGASFVIGVEFVSILSVGTLSRGAFLRSSAVVGHAPAVGSPIWLPAYAAAGDWRDLAIVLAVAVTMLAGSIRFCAPRFAALVQTAAAIPEAAAQTRRRRSRFRPRSPAQALRNKEWMLLRRDPWLISQSLMQLLYLLPPFFLLWRGFFHGGRGMMLLVPVLIMAAGQLAGGLAWLAVSGEDAPDLIGSAPVTTVGIWRAKVEAVAGALALVFGPALALLAIAQPRLALIALLGIVIAAAASTLIQFWFRAQVKRSLFRRRHVSSRIATFAEAFSSVAWSGAGAVALVDPWLAAIPGGAALVILAGAWSISPKRG